MLEEFGFQVFRRYGIPEGAIRKYFARELSKDEIRAAEREWEELAARYFATSDEAEREDILRRAKELLETKLPAPSYVAARPI